MAQPKKLSELNAITSTTNESLVYVSNSTDGGTSFTGKQITFQDFVSEVLAKSDLGVFTGDVITDNTTVKAALQSIEEEIESQNSAKAELSAVNEIDANVNDLIAMSGVAENATDLGSFSGTVISDNTTVKNAFQELEVALETETANRATAITNAIDALGDSAPGTLDTLNEIAAALNDDPDIANTLTGLVNTEQAAREAADLTLTTNKVARGENVNELVATTTPEAVPATYYFLVVDAATGDIKVVEKSFMEID